MRLPALVWLLTPVLSTGVLACQVRDSNGDTRAGGAAPAPAAASSASAARSTARWRLMTRERLSQVVLHLSHILIRHRDVATRDVSFCAAEWKVSLPPETRSPSEALALARSIAASLQREPERFAEYAARYSEDLATRETGGSLGGKAADQLVLWEEVLDALAPLQVGQVSNVVETEFGYHVLLLRPVPEEATVSGRRLVIGYDDAGWLSSKVGRGAIPSRSRDAALALARTLVQRARQAPDEFQELIEEHSEHRDAAQGGDLGACSTRAICNYPREREALRLLPVGGISEPLDSLFGFEILQRTRDVPRARYALTALALVFDPGVSDDEPAHECDFVQPCSRTAALRQAQSLAQEIGGDPAKFAESQRVHCCADIVQFDEGTVYPEVGRVLSRMNFGEVASEPIESGNQGGIL